MPNDPLTLYVISGILAFIPALIWLTVLFKRTKRKGIQILLFVGSIFSVIPLLGFQYLLALYPQLNILNYVQANIENQNINLILLFISVGISEEIVKQALIRLIDRRYLLIQTINESIQFSLIGALSFSFAENIFYIYGIYSAYGIQQLFVTYLFRTVFTTCAHLIFSGFFGYYYGIAKFSLNIVEQSRWVGNKKRFINFIADKFDISTFEAYKKIMIMKGLLIAIFMHATFNFLLQLNQILPVVAYVLFGYFFLRHLLKQKTGHLIMISDSSQEKTSTMAQNDEDVVVELVGMWFKDKRYVDVIHICQRMLERDPDNKVIELFKAKAIDQLGKNDPYSHILKNLFPKKKMLSIEEETKKNRKEGKTTVVPQAAIPEETNSPENKETNTEETFHLKI
jgi:RsiW-degrading membrane proteinase PrsW (M82 family)